MLVDGTGKNMFPGVLGIKDEKIALVEKTCPPACNARKIIDVSGLTITPGFIDIHSHSEIQPLVDPLSASKLYDGVTTIVSGNCGFSVFPWSEETPRDAFPLFRDFDVKVGWSSFGQWAKLLEKQKPALNHASFVGHGTLRIAVCGLDYRSANERELDEMAALLRKSMAEGALGLSSGLEYNPACCAEADELHMLAKVVAENDGCYSSHLRDEGAGVVTAVAEAIDVSRATRVRTQLSHLKAYRKENWHFLEKIIEDVEEARAEGLPLLADRYPYCATSTTLHAIMPLWLLDGGIEAMLWRLSKSDGRARLRTDFSATDEEFWQEVVLAFGQKEENLPFLGKSIAEISSLLGQNPLDTFIEIVASEEGGAMGVYHTLSENNLKRLLTKSWVMVGSDGSARNVEGPTSKGIPHPRCYGTFARLLGRYVRQEGLLDLPTAIQKITSQPALQLGFTDRGKLLPGMVADITVFDSEKIVDKATYDAPHQYSKGIRHVFVNGAHTLTDGHLTSKRGGQVIRRPSLL